MKIKNKITSLLVVLILLITNFPVISYASSMYAPDEYEDTIGMLNALEIINLEGTQEDAAISDSQALSAILSLTGKKDKIKNGEDPYELARTAGVFENNVPEKFNDENAFIAALLNALGYGKMAAYNGGYPVGYSQQMGQRFIGEVEFDNILTNKEAATLLSKALFLEVQGITASNEISGLGVNALERYFSAYKEDGIVTGVYLQAIMGNPAQSRNHVVIDSIEYMCNIENSRDYLGKKVTFIYSVDKDDDKTVLYMIADDESFLEIERAMLDDYRLEDDIFKIEYADMREKIYKIKAGTKYISVNGEIYDYANENIEDALDFNVGKLQFSDFDDDGVYDIIMIWKYDNYLVSYTTKTALYDKGALPPVYIEEDLYDDLYTEITLDGNAVSLDKIQENYIASVYRNKNGNIIKIEASSQMTSGKIEKIIKNDTLPIFIIERIPYYVTASINNIQTGLECIFYLDTRGNVGGIEITQSVEKYGFLVSTYKEDEEVKLRICIEGGEGLETFDVKSSVRVRFPNDTTPVKYSEFQLYEDLKNNEELYLFTLIKFMTGKDGITIIKYPKDYSNVDVLNYKVNDFGFYGGYYEESSAGIYESKGYSGGKYGKYFIDTVSPVVFSVPKDKSRDSINYSGSATLKENVNYTAKVYDMDYFLNAKAVVLYEKPKVVSTGYIQPTAGIDGGVHLSVIKSIDAVYDSNADTNARLEIKVLTEDGEMTLFAPFAERALLCYEFGTGYFKDKTSIYPSSVWESPDDFIIDTTKIFDDDYNLLNVGDVVQIQRDEDNNLIQVKRFWSSKRNQLMMSDDNARDEGMGADTYIPHNHPGHMTSCPSWDWALNRGYYTFGDVFRIGPSNIVVDTRNPLVDNTAFQKEYGGVYALPSLNDSTVVYIYDRDKGTVKEGSKDDLKIGDEIVTFYYTVNNSYRGVLIVR